MTPKAAWRKTATSALAEVARLTAENRRMQRELEHVAGWESERDEVYGDLAQATDELRRVRSLLGFVEAAERAMPWPPESAA